MVIISSEIYEMCYIDTTKLFYIHENPCIYQRIIYKRNDRGWAHYLENFTLKGWVYVQESLDKDGEFISW